MTRFKISYLRRVRHFTSADQSTIKSIKSASEVTWSVWPNRFGLIVKKYDGLGKPICVWWLKNVFFSANRTWNRNRFGVNKYAYRPFRKVAPCSGILICPPSASSRNVISQGNTIQQSSLAAFPECAWWRIWWTDLVLRWQRDFSERSIRTLQANKTSVNLVNTSK